jgi:transcriptional regulator with XRE-family HTH domain
MPRSKRGGDVWRALTANPAEYPLWDAKQRFAYRLHRCMQLRGMSNSDLARLMWGETTDLMGHRVAKNRDLISLYLRGARFPEPRTMERLAKALDVGVNDLAYDAEGTTLTGDAEQPAPQVQMTLVGPDEVRLAFDHVLPTVVATKIMELLGTLRPPQGRYGGTGGLKTDVSRRGRKRSRGGDGDGGGGLHKEAALNMA